MLLSLVITGCGKDDKLVCSKEQTLGTTKLNIKVEVSLDDGYATKMVTTNDVTFNDETSAETFKKIYDGKEGYKVKQDGKKVNVTQTEEVAKDKRKTDETKKDYVKKQMEDEGFTCSK